VINRIFFKGSGLETRLVFVRLFKKNGSNGVYYPPFFSTYTQKRPQDLWNSWTLDISKKNDRPKNFFEKPKI
jgi:hypothetical protein